MNTIIRVKRHLKDDPVEAVLLECKRRRTEEAGGSESFEKVLNFLGTVENKNDDFVSQRTLGISPIYQRRIKELKNSKPKFDPLSKVRKDTKTRSDENRFKVVSCKRSISKTDELDSAGDEKKENLAIVDVDLERSKNEDATSDDLFVYDIYSANLENDYFNDIYLDNVIGIEPYTSEQIFEYRNPEDYTDEDYDPEDDDSNDENNWRNSYPDEEGSDSEEIDVLTCEFQKFGRDDRCDLSSDDGEDKYLNYEDSNDRSDYLFYDAESIGGSSYAKYKKKVLNEFKASESFDSGDDDNDGD